MLTYPNIDPVAIALGPLKIHWYGLMYLVGIGGAWWLASRRLQRFDSQWTKDTLSDLVFWVAMGVILGGRLGYVLFYDLAAYIDNPRAGTAHLGRRHVVPWRFFRGDAGGLVVWPQTQQKLLSTDGLYRALSADRSGCWPYW